MAANSSGPRTRQRRAARAMPPCMMSTPAPTVATANADTSVSEPWSRAHSSASAAGNVRIASPNRTAAEHHPGEAALARITACQRVVALWDGDRNNRRLEHRRTCSGIQPTHPDGDPGRQVVPLARDGRGDQRAEDRERRGRHDHRTRLGPHQHHRIDAGEQLVGRGGSVGSEAVTRHEEHGELDGTADEDRSGTGLTTRENRYEDDGQSDAGAREGLECRARCAEASEHAAPGHGADHTGPTHPTCGGTHTMASFTCWSMSGSGALHGCHETAGGPGEHPEQGCEPRSTDRRVDERHHGLVANRRQRPAELAHRREHETTRESIAARIIQAGDGSRHDLERGVEHQGGQRRR